MPQCDIYDPRSNPENVSGPEVRKKAVLYCAMACSVVPICTGSFDVCT